MSNVTFKLDYAGVGKLLHSEMLTNYVESIANQKIQNASGTYTVAKRNQQTRNYVVIYPSDKETYFRNLNNNELLKVVGV